MKACGAMCGDSFSGMQPQARQYRTFANIPNVAKGSTPLTSKIRKCLCLLDENEKTSGSPCGDCVGDFESIHYSQNHVRFVNKKITTITT